MSQYVPRKPWQPSPAMLQYLDTLTSQSARMRTLGQKARAASSW